MGRILAAVIATLSREKKAGDRKIWTVDGIEYAFRWCPAGTFTMGSPSSVSNWYDEGPQHSVTLTKGFWMLETQVTQKMWKSVMRNNPSSFPGEQNPVECVSWHKCREFCKALSSKLGVTVDLPTEAQWEYACRAGTTGAYAGDLDAMAWYSKNSGMETHPVGQKKANTWGLYDMYGNVWEWCLDWYRKDYYTESPTSDPCGPNNGSIQVIRGGGWSNNIWDCRSANRGHRGPGSWYYDLGFRIVLAESDK